MRSFPLLLCAIFVLANSVYSAPGNKSPSTSENVSDSTLKEISEKRDSEIKEAENSTKSLIPHHQEDPKLLTEKNVSAGDLKKETISPSNNETSSAQKEPASSAKRQLTVEELKSYIEYYSEELRRRSNLKALIAWQFATNITEENSKAKVEGSLEMSTWKRNEWLHNISQFDLSVLESPHYQNLKRLFDQVKVLGTDALDGEKISKQGYDARKMFELADKFFKDLGLESVNEGAKDFYNLSMIEKPEGRKVVCHASAWDFSASNQLPGDFRIKMCTDVTMNDFITVHHELGHIQYYMQYVDQNPLFREGANPGFHEAIGDTLALSVSTPGHLQAIGLLDKDFKLDDDADLSYLLRVALDKVSFLPFGYLIDLYRWKLFEGEIEFKDLNDEWWLLREGYQGIRAPVERCENDFDAGAKYHVAAGVPYIRYFISHILQFEFHQALCEAAGEFDQNAPEKKPLHLCDINGSKLAGNKLKRLLKAGGSKHWEEVLEDMTGQREMSVQPLLNYFKPLRKYLQDYIKEHNVPVGWEIAF
ncbi:unnamed protein product [Notodromas monacha]|uniref:Angiotensin-converting enzyme n=1 Tax=Notodromas monacha TaxID=399045 RepID=A0A7R9BMR4_9CRUS|nr:unnamed protein product [Notodromas monacha]CAG0916995.1 unnamed protein product [Notodromas monacha]